MQYWIVEKSKIFLLEQESWSTCMSYHIHRMITDIITQSYRHWKHGGPTHDLVGNSAWVTSGSEWIMERHMEWHIEHIKKATLSDRHQFEIQSLPFFTHKIMLKVTFVLNNHNSWSLIKESCYVCKACNVCNVCN